MRRRTTMTLIGLILSTPLFGQGKVVPMVVTGSLSEVRYETTIVAKPEHYDPDISCLFTLKAADVENGNVYPDPPLIQYSDPWDGSPTRGDVIIDWDIEGEHGKWDEFGFSRTFSNPVFITQLVPNDTVQFGLLGAWCGDTAFNLYATYAAYDIESGNKIAEATVFGSEPAETLFLVADQSDGSRMAMALANNAELDTVEIKISIGSRRSTIVEVPYQSVRTFFLDEVLDVESNEVALVEMSVVARTQCTATHAGERPVCSSGPQRQEPCVRSDDGPRGECEFNAMGLRFSDGIFSTVPPLP